MLAAVACSPILILLNYDPGKVKYPVVKIREFGRSIVETERFNLYLLEYGKEGHSD